MKKLNVVVIFLVLLSCSKIVQGVTTFYSFDQSPNPDLMNLVRYTSDPYDTSVTVISSMSNFPTISSDTYMDLSPDGYLFAAPYGGTVYKIDPKNGGVLGSVQVITSNAIEGIAVSDTGLVYASVEKHARIYEVDFDQQTKRSVAYVSFDLDDIDFDDVGNLVNSDINQSGNLYRVPLDNSPAETVADYSAHSGLSMMSFSMEDSAFYFISYRQDLWRLDWSNGQPIGNPYFVKTIGSGEYVGLAAAPNPIPAPGAILLGSMGIGLVGWLRKKKVL